MIKGESRDLNKVTEVVIPASVVNLSSITGDFETTVDINQYLPVNVKVLNADEAIVKIKVDVNNKTSKVFKIPTDNLTINNLAPGLKGEFDDKYVNVEIVALQEQLNKLNENTISGFVDASGLAKGTHSVVVVLSLDNEYQAKTTTTKLIVE
jgi:YbbR domain-containing protein